MYKLIIDVSTVDAYRLIKILERLKSTWMVEHGGKYHEDERYSQVHVETTKTVEEMEDWLYKTKYDFDYVGVTEFNGGEDGE